ncbi:hypothetical protein B0H13DRAFT_2102174 [Mycena leptocephala]|nr:hypothetical protein B0H13DRAFT_2102174 [Mycena leptocephala]
MICYCWLLCGIVHYWVFLSGKGELLGATRRYGSLCARATQRYEELPDRGTWLRAATIRGTCLRGYHGYFGYQALRNHVLFS